MNEGYFIEDILHDKDTEILLNQCIAHTLNKNRESAFEIYCVLNNNYPASDRLIFSKKINGKKKSVRSSLPRPSLAKQLNLESELVYPIVSFHTHPNILKKDYAMHYPSRNDIINSILDYNKFKEVEKIMSQCISHYRKERTLSYLRRYNTTNSKKWNIKKILVSKEHYFESGIVPPVRIIVDCSRKDIPILVYQFTQSIDIENIETKSAPNFYFECVKNGIIEEIRLNYDKEKQKIVFNQNTVEFTLKQLNLAI